MKEAWLCILSSGEAYIRDRSVTFAPGDLAFIPASVIHDLPNPAGSGEGLVVVNQIAPPRFDLYEDAGSDNR